ncbi:hypothetical protein ACA351_11180 [Orientia tsutsugamushi]|uniref:hypothetical protein n=1 Tax=Orientia tsutsugamushi TaxID=784 RepID=UPI00352805B0
MFKRYRLEEFYPLTPEDAVILQHKSDRGFNIYFINKLLLKLADRYSNYHFGCKASVLNYMAKTLANELIITMSASCSIEPDYRRSERIGFLSDLCSTALDN